MWIVTCRRRTRLTWTWLAGRRRGDSDADSSGTGDEKSLAATDVNTDAVIAESAFDDEDDADVELDHGDDTRGELADADGTAGRGGPVKESDADRESAAHGDAPKATDETFADEGDQKRLPE